MTGQKHKNLPSNFSPQGDVTPSYGGLFFQLVNNVRHVSHFRRWEMQFILSPESDSHLSLFFYRQHLFVTNVTDILFYDHKSTDMKHLRRLFGGILTLKYS